MKRAIFSDIFGRFFFGLCSVSFFLFFFFFFSFFFLFSFFFFLVFRIGSFCFGPYHILLLDENKSFVCLVVLKKKINKKNEKIIKITI